MVETLHLLLKDLVKTTGCISENPLMSEIEARLCPFCRDCVNLQMDLLSDGDLFPCLHCRSVYLFLVSGEGYDSHQLPAASKPELSKDALFQS